MSIAEKMAKKRLWKKPGGKNRVGQQFKPGVFYPKGDKLYLGMPDGSIRDVTERVKAQMAAQQGEQG